MSALLSNDSSAENCNKPNHVDSQKHNLEEESLITSHYSGTQEFSATPISPQSITTTSMSASGKFLCQGASAMMSAKFLALSSPARHFPHDLISLSREHVILFNNTLVSTDIKRCNVFE